MCFSIRKPTAILNESIDQNQRQLEGYLKELEELASRIGNSFQPGAAPFNAHNF